MGSVTAGHPNQSADPGDSVAPNHARLSFCMVTTFYPPYHFGGEAAFLYGLCNGLAERGHRVTVVHCVDAYRALTKAGPRGEFPHHPNVTVVPLHSRLGALSPTMTYLTGRPGLKARPLSAVFRENRFDVTHYHLSTLIGPGAFSYGQGIKLYTTHDHWLVCPMYDLWRDNRQVCEEPHCLRCTINFRRPPQLWRYTGLLARQQRQIDLFLAPSRSVIEQHQRRGFDAPMRYLPHFLPPSTAPAPAEASDGIFPAGGRSDGRSRPYFLFVGRLVKVKGVQTLIETFRHYDEADLLIAGDGAYERELRAQAAGLEHVRFLGRVRPDELGSLYRGAMAVLVPSLVYETFGLVALEAFRQGVPVIGRDHGAVPELIRESGGGFTYRTDAELVEEMEGLRRDPGLRERLGQRAYRGFVERWSQEAHMRGYFEAIEEARERRRDKVGAVA
jgi:glycosyltransferase involved in cell wall biosynthesis